MGPFYKGLVIWEATLYQLKLWRAILQIACSLGGHFILFSCSFKDRERMVVELKVFFLDKLYHDDAADYFHFSSFHDFLDIFLFLVRRLSCILHMYLGGLMNSFYVSKK